MRLARGLALFGGLLAAAPALAAGALQSGPMAGPAAMREVPIWFQADSPASARIEYWAGDEARHRHSATIKLDAAEDYAATLRLVGLEPGVRYRYQLFIDDKAAGPVGEVATRVLWQRRRDAPDFRVLTGSCAYFKDPPYDRPGSAYGSGTGIFDAMADKQPDLTLWLGDNLYFREADFSPWGMGERYRVTRARPELQKLLRRGQHAAIWDDHDYGPNNANASWIHKGEALRLFRRYWPNPGYGLPEAPGVFTVLSLGDADFFLLDDRYYRDADPLPEQPGKAMLGPAQLRWLQNALLNSTAAFKLIANGSQMLDDLGRHEGWNRFAGEQSGFLSWLAQSGISGLLFLSGDRHHTELLRIERRNRYPLYELTCSPFTSGTHGVEKERQNPNLVAGTLVGERNFCSLEFTGTGAARAVTLRSFNGEGRELWARTLTLSELGGRKRSTD